MYAYNCITFLLRLHIPFYTDIEQVELTEMHHACEAFFQELNTGVIVLQMNL